MKYLSFFVFWFCSASAHAQIPATCFSNTAPPSDLCTSACLYCDFNGMMSTTVGYTGQAPPGWCGIAENDQWLSFLAACSSVTFIATPSNCTDGNGLQLGVYAHCDSMPIGCNGGATGLGTTPVSVTVPTTIGQHYYLCIDGFAGDQCDFNITVVPPNCAGITMLLPTLPIIGVDEICPGETSTFTVPAVTGASFYIWDAPPGSTINGAPPPVTLAAPGGNTVDIRFPTSPFMGVFPICVQPVNACVDGTVMCKNVQIKPVPVTVLPNITICPDDLPYITPWGDSVYTTGLYTYNEPTASGCDSVSRQFVAVRPPVNTVLPPLGLCSGDNFEICGVSFSQAGMQSAVCQTIHGCDSTILFELRAVSDTQPMYQINYDCVAQAAQVTILPQALADTLFLYDAQGNFVSSEDTLVITQNGSYTLEVHFAFTGCVLSQNISINIPTTSTTQVVGQIWVDVDNSCSLTSSDTLAYADIPVIFSANGQQITTVANSSGQYQLALLPGTYDALTVTTGMGNPQLCPDSVQVLNCQAAPQQIDLLLQPGPSAVQDLSGFQQLSITPNPATHAVQVRGAAFAEGDKLNWQIINELGRVVQGGIRGTHPLQLPVSSLPPGLYLLAVRSDEVAAFGKFLIAR